MKVTGIATQGRQDADQWVTAYYLYVSADGVNFAKVKHWWNYVKVEKNTFSNSLIIHHVKTKEIITVTEVSIPALH